MTFKRFGEGDDFDDEALIVFENFGITVYLAQLYEGFLSNLLTGLERLGAIEIPRDGRQDNIGYLDENLGSMFRILLAQSKIDRLAKSDIEGLKVENPTNAVYRKPIRVADGRCAAIVRALN